MFQVVVAKVFGWVFRERRVGGSDRRERRFSPLAQGLLAAGLTLASYVGSYYGAQAGAKVTEPRFAAFDRAIQELRACSKCPASLPVAASLRMEPR